MDLYTYLKALKMGRSGSLFEDLVAIKRKTGSVIKTEFAAIASFITKRAQTAIAVEVQLDPIQEGSGTPSPDNVRPIYGRTEVDTYVGGVNVWDEEWRLASLNINTGAWSSIGTYSQIASANMIPVKSNTEYYFASPNIDGAYVAQYRADGTYIGYVFPRLAGRVFTTPSDCAFIMFQMNKYGNTYNNGISINYPSTDHEYHAYDGTTYTTDLGRTVYGGTLDVVSGELVVDRAMVDLGDLEWNAHSSGNYYVENAISGYIPNRLAICSRYAHVADVTAVVYLTTDGAFALQSIFDGARTRLIIRDTTFEGYTASQVKSALVGSQLCYELATPQTCQLTPTEVSLLLGQNNVWSDGDVSVTYVG